MREGAVLEFVISIPDEQLIAAQQIDKVTEQENRRIRTQIERDTRKKVDSIEVYGGNIGTSESVEDTVVVQELYWDVLRVMPPQSALFLVLRYCLGRSCTEIAAGLHLPYWKVKDGCKLGASRAREMYE